jgi:hypothetical protein
LNSVTCASVAVTTDPSGQVMVAVLGPPWKCTVSDPFVPVIESPEITIEMQGVLSPGP